jgi:hypothetical protein
MIFTIPYSGYFANVGSGGLKKTDFFAVLDEFPAIYALFS